MGACAFEAYNVPYQTHGINQVDGDGAEVVYMDRDFLASIVKGVMQVIPCPNLVGKAQSFSREVPSTCTKSTWLGFCGIVP